MCSSSPRSCLSDSFRQFRAAFLSVFIALVVTATIAQTNATPYVFSHLAGSIGGPGSTDGMGPSARFDFPISIAVDAAGNAYVSDSDNHTIRKITTSGMVTTLAGTAGNRGSADGNGLAAQFDNPQGVAVDSAGNVYVADSGAVRKITSGGVVTTLAGTPGAMGYVDGTGPAAKFYHLKGVAVDAAGNVYVADRGIGFVGETGNNTLRKITSGGVVTTLAAWVASSYVANPTPPLDFIGVAVDAAGNVYATDPGDNIIRKITPSGVVTTLAGDAGNFGSSDGTGQMAQFGSPTGIAVDSAGNVYVADSIIDTIRKITPGGVVTTLAGTVSVMGSSDGTGPAALFKNPLGVAVDNAGVVYVADTNNHTIRKITSVGMVTTLAGTANIYGSADETGLTARFYGPENVAVDNGGNVYVADFGNNTIRKITPSGVVTTLAGTAGVQGSADGTGPAAQFHLPEGVAVDNVGNVYVADSNNNTIRRITAGGVVTTLAGTGAAGSADGSVLAAQFRFPTGITVDLAGNIYLADTYNQTIRKITTSGVVTTLAGMAGVQGSSDGTGSAARFYAPIGIALDNVGNVYVGDSLNNTIRKIASGGEVTTLAGTANAQGSADGTGPAAQFYSPRGVAVDNANNVYVADIINHTIRKITPSGVVTTLAGTAGVKGSADGIGSAAQFYYPTSIAVDSTGAIYVADSGNNAIRKGVPAVAPVITGQPLSQTVVAGGSVQFSVVAGGVPNPTYQWNFNGSVFSGATSSTLSFASARSADAGDYTVVVTNALGSVTSAKATLTVSAAPVTPPVTTPASSGGGGAINEWFVLALLALVGARGFMGSRKS